ncbi:universal stress protein [Symbioplanes lichenis]|uniref:universal stress protein n=1 Tax=Symbioplanes lichenis TaxID=1629072 RepID=UPI0027387AF2|nr:universal stress protein [Actinoplanes lichenis]
MTTRRIIVGYDGSAEARAAARWALDEAAGRGATPVEFLYAYEWPAWTPAASLAPGGVVWPDSETEGRIAAMLTEVVDAARDSHPGVDVTLTTVTAGAAATLIRLSRTAGLVVLGSRGHAPVVNLLGSVSVAVSAHAHCPVVVVRADQDPRGPVVAGVDGSDGAEVALEFAVEQAARRDVPLHLIAARPPDARPDSRYLDELVDSWRRKRPGLRITGETAAGHPAEVLVRAAQGAQLLVAGSRSRGAFRGMLLGSVSQHLLRFSPTTVAVVRELSAA